MHIQSKLPILPSDSLRLSNLLVPDVYRQVGQKYPDRLFARAMDGDDTKIPLVDITWGRMLNDAHRVAESMDRSLVDATVSKTVGLLGASGYQYYIHVVACWLNGWSVILLSIRNSVTALDSLLKVVDASALLIDRSHSKIGEDLRVKLPNISLMLMQDPRVEPAAKDYVFGGIVNPNPSAAQLDTVAVYAHTSGSEGHPKPVPSSHRHFLALIRVRSASQYAGIPAYVPVPLFHGMGFYAFTRWPLGSGVVPTFITMKKPLTGEAMLRHFGALPGSVAFLPPSVLEEVADKSSSELATLRAAKRILFAGAPIKPDAAEKLIKAGVPLASAFGSSELGIMTVLDFSSDDHLADWSYVRFRDDHYTLHFLPVDDSPARELIVSPDANDAPAVLNCQDPVGFASRDMWLPHPNIPGLWKHIGRKDAVTVLSNGEKTNNKQLETLLLEDRHIRRVIVFGTGKPLNGVVIEPSQPCPKDQIAAFVRSIWPTIERVNTIIPQHSRLLRQMILIADEAKPFVSTDKGTTRLGATLALYNAEIEAAYIALETPGTDKLADSRYGSADILQFVRSVVHRITSNSIGDEEDFFDHGMDSLRAFQLRLELLPLLKNSAGSSNAIPHNVIYLNSTISRLASYVKACRQGKKMDASSLDDKLIRIKQCLERFNGEFTTTSEQKQLPDSDSEGYTIALTGATGSLGCHILRELLPRQDVERIFCLHRSPVDTAIQRQTQVLTERGIPLDLLHQFWDKLEFIAIDLSIPSLGLNHETLEKFRSRVTHIIHTAWELNFNWKLERFERVHLAGVRHLADLAMISRRPQPPRLVFLSSIGAVSHAVSPVPEQPNSDPLLASDHGYGEAKYVAERIIDSACKAGLHATVIRAGQLSGSTIDGYWAASEYIPILLRSSMKLGVIPDKLPDTRWIPTDVVARCVLDLSLRHDSSQLAYYHVENATPTPWPDIVQLYTRAVGIDIRSIPASDWLKTVEQAGAGIAPADEKSADIPAKSLLQFYSEYAAAGRQDSWVELDVTEARRICPRVDFGPITMDIMQKYVKWMDSH